jgi:cytochrome c oxidase assembly protein subunit 15
MHASSPDRPVTPGFVLLVSLAALLVFIVVVLSAYIRLNDAGLGCVDWPACFGQAGAQDNRSLAEGGPLLPPSAARTFHRVAATGLSFMVVGIVFLAFRRRHTGTPGLALPLGVLGLTVFLSVLGIVTPSPLVPIVTAGNVLGGMLMLALLWAISDRLQPSATVVDPAIRRLRPWTRVALALVVTQIALGAWVSGSYAGPACPSPVNCAVATVSAETLAQGYSLTQRLERDAAGKVVVEASAPLVHLVHRLSALATTLLLVWLALRARAASRRLHGAAHALLGLLAAQLVLGFGSVAAQLPLSLVTAHNAGAALLLLATLHLHLRLSTDR